MEKKEWLRKASGGEGEIYSVMYAGTQKRAVIHIVHGMSEHSGRYERLARFLVRNGFVVVMEDLQGHGRSARHPGHFGDRNGWENLLNDLKNLTDEAKQRFPKLPVFMLGHSMGSFLARCYVVRWKEDLSGLMLSGTMGNDAPVRLGLAVAGIQRFVQGPKAEAKLIRRLGAWSYNRKIKNPVNQYAWLSTVRGVSREFEADDLSGVDFTAAAYYDMFRGLKMISSERWALQVPKIPVYIFAGGSDPVGAFGKGPAEVYAWLKKTGHDTELKIYPGDRHETLNETNREQVYADLLDWLNRHVP